MSNQNLKVNYAIIYVLDVGSGGVHCFDLSWHLVVGGSLAGPPPTDWVVHACYHLPMFN